jgi:O-antigen ligase
LIGGLALAGGGYEVGDRHIAGLLAWLVVVALLVLGGASAATVARPFYWAGGSILGLALLSAISSLWSGSMELSVIEADRVLVYLAVFVATFLIAQTENRRQRFAEGLVISVTFVALLGLGSRLLPHVLNVADSLGTGPRLRYPLGYWNANGAMFGIAAGTLLWMSRRAAWTALQWVSAAALPAVLLAIYFCYSRGGLLALVIAAGCVIALSRDRLWMLATLAIGAIGALPALIAAQDRRDLADNLATQTSVDQGLTVFLILLAGIALAVGLFALLRWAERREGALTGRALELSRHPPVLKGVAAAIAVAAIGIAVAVGGRAWSQFSSSDIQFPSQPEAHFSQLNGAGRHDFWRVAIDTFEADPILGSGAGTYEFAWEERRSIAMPVHDAHSLYLESFAELGVVGGVLVLFLVGSMLWTGFAAWRDAPHPQRERYAALLAAMLAFAIGAALDWFWELAALGAVFFIAGGIVTAARCRQLADARAAAAGGAAAAAENGRARSRSEGRRYGLAVAGVAIAWIAAVALVGPLLVDRELTASRDAAAGQNLPSAIDHAKRARSIEPWAASPYVQLGLLAELEGNYPVAVVHYTHAIEREDHNWQWYYLRSKSEHLEGDEAAARADLRRARELNPRASCLSEGWNCG